MVSSRPSLVTSRVNHWFKRDQRRVHRGESEKASGELLLSAPGRAGSGQLVPGWRSPCGTKSELAAEEDAAVALGTDLGLHPDVEVVEVAPIRGTGELVAFPRLTSTPFSTFQSPGCFGAVFQPARSLPLNSGIHDRLYSCARTAGPVQASNPMRNAAETFRFMTIKMPVSLPLLFGLMADEFVDDSLVDSLVGECRDERMPQDVVASR